MAGGNTGLHRLDEYFISKLCNHSAHSCLKFGGMDAGEIRTCVELFIITAAIWKFVFNTICRRKRRERGGLGGGVGERRCYHCGSNFQIKWSRLIMYQSVLDFIMPDKYSNFVAGLEYLGVKYLPLTGRAVMYCLSRETPRAARDSKEVSSFISQLV